MFLFFKVHKVLASLPNIKFFSIIHNYEDTLVSSNDHLKLMDLSSFITSSITIIIIIIIIIISSMSSLPFLWSISKIRLSIYS